MTQLDKGSVESGTPYSQRNIHTSVDKSLGWKTSSLLALSNGNSSSGIHSENANILLLLLSFLSTPNTIPLDLLYRGATPRKRWNLQGEIEDMDPNQTSLAPELIEMLSDMSRLKEALHELGISSSISVNSDNTYAVNGAAAEAIRNKLSPELASFWRCQALIVAYRALPWKYAEPPVLNIKLFLPHLEHTLQAVQDCKKCLNVVTRADLVLTLLQGSRFPNMAWKRFAVSQAEAAGNDLEDLYLHCCLAVSQCLLGRLGGDMDKAASSLSDLHQGKLLQTSQIRDHRTHSAIGWMAIQHCLNCVQVEDMSGAKISLEKWDILEQKPSLLENAVIFRKDMMLGRIFRFQGAFEQSLTHLEDAKRTAECCEGLFFDEDLSDLTCDLADTLRELNDPISAERHLRTEITRRQQKHISTGQTSLHLSLAEALFAQARFREAEQLCLDIQSRSNLLKFERLRMHIIMAKIRHVEQDHEGALSWWSGAMTEIGRFHLTNGRATRIIVISICDALSGLDHTWLVRSSFEQVDSLDKTAKPGGVQYWIAGMCHWLGYLESKNLRSRM